MINYFRVFFDPLSDLRWLYLGAVGGFQGSGESGLIAAVVLVDVVE